MKIVSLFPAGSEIICEMGLSENLIAVSHECDYPALLKKKIQVTSSIIPKSTDQILIDKLVKNAIQDNLPIYQINNDKILDINPDLIITQGLCEVCSISENVVQATLKNNLCTLTNKTKVISMNATTFDEICAEIIMIGQEVDKLNIAKAIVETAFKKKNNLSKKITNKKILLLEWINPYFTPGHWIPEQIEMAGFVSCIGKKGEKSKELNFEKIIEMDPDYIGLICCGFNLEENRLFANQLYEDSRINHLDAIRNERVFAFDSNSYFSRPSLRILEGVEQLKEAFLYNNEIYQCKRSTY